MKKLLIIILLAPVFCFGQKDSSNAIPKWNIYVLVHTNPHYFELEVPGYVEKKISPVSFGGGAEFLVFSTKKKVCFSVGLELYQGEEALNVYSNPNNKTFIDTNQNSLFWYEDLRYLTIGLTPKISKVICFKKMKIVGFIKAVGGFKSQVLHKNDFYFNGNLTSSLTRKHSFSDSYKTHFSFRLGASSYFSKISNIGLTIETSIAESSIYFPGEFPFGFFLILSKGF